MTKSRAKCAVQQALTSMLNNLTQSASSLSLATTFPLHGNTRRLVAVRCDKLQPSLMFLDSISPHISIRLALALQSGSHELDRLRHLQRKLSHRTELSPRVQPSHHRLTFLPIKIFCTLSQCNTQHPEWNMTALHVSFCERNKTQNQTPCTSIYRRCFCHLRESWDEPEGRLGWVSIGFCCHSCFSCHCSTRLSRPSVSQTQLGSDETSEHPSAHNAPSCL